MATRPPVLGEPKRYRRWMAREFARAKRGRPEPAVDGPLSLSEGRGSAGCTSAGGDATLELRPAVFGQPQRAARKGDRTRGRRSERVVRRLARSRLMGMRCGRAQTVYMIQSGGAIWRRSARTL